MENLYAELSEEPVEHIYLIAPNHFNYGHSYIRTTDEDFAEYSTFIADEVKDFDLEHGVTVHYDFMNRYFPGADVTPVIIKNDTPVDRLDALVSAIIEQDLSNALVIGSIDFTHLDPENIARQNDDRTIAWLEEFPNNEHDLDSIVELAKTTNPNPEWESVSMDSPETMYVLTQVMESLGSTHFELWDRTSSGSMVLDLDAADNTSHIYGTFKSRE